MTNYKGVFKQIDLEKIDCYSLEKDEESFVINLNNIFHIEFIEFEILDKFDIKIYFSGDKITWIEKKEEHLLVDFSKFSLTYSDKEKYQYIKINTKIDNIKDKKVNIFIRKFPGLMIAARSDGFGARFMPILNAMYLAEYTGFKFGFVWKKSGLDESSLKKFENNELAGIYLSNENDIFATDFIEQYSYTDKLNSDRGLLEKKSLEEINFPNEKWGWYISQSTPQLIFDTFNQNFARDYPRLWKKIKFSDKMQKVIDKANKLAKFYFPSKFIAIHIRSGDIVYDEAVYSQGIEWLKAMPIEIAIHLIEENLNKNEKIVLFGDDFTSLRQLKVQYGINIVEDFIDDNLSGIERIIFEIVFMSNAKDAFTGHSSFARVATYIGIGREPTFYYKFFSRHKIYSIIQEKVEISKSHEFQKSFSYFFLFRLSIALNKKPEESLKWIIKAWKFNENNELYKLGVILYYIICKQNKSAEKILYENPIKNIFFKNYYRKSFFGKNFKLYCKDLHVHEKDFPCIYNILKRLQQEHDNGYRI